MGFSAIDLVEKALLAFTTRVKLPQSLTNRLKPRAPAQSAIAEDQDPINNEVAAYEAGHFLPSPPLSPRLPRINRPLDTIFEEIQTKDAQTQTDPVEQSMRKEPEQVAAQVNPQTNTQDNDEHQKYVLPLLPNNG